MLGLRLALWLWLLGRILEGEGGLQAWVQRTLAVVHEVSDLEYEGAVVHEGAVGFEAWEGRGRLR